MIELIRTNDLVLLVLAQGLLEDADVVHFVADAHMSAIEGSIGVFQRRLLVAADQEQAARAILSDAGLAAELRPPRP